MVNSRLQPRRKLWRIHGFRDQIPRRRLGGVQISNTRCVQFTRTDSAYGINELGGNRRRGKSNLKASIGLERGVLVDALKRTLFSHTGVVLIESFGCR
jgi:hypothetical protein